MHKAGRVGVEPPTFAGQPSRMTKAGGFTPKPRTQPLRIRDVPMKDSTQEHSVRTGRSMADRLAIQPDLTRRLLVEFIRNETRKFGFNRVVLGLSGGIDSALSATLAAEALGPENVV